MRVSYHHALLTIVEKDDGFGRDDSDWAVYRELGGEEDSDAEEDDLLQLETVETKLSQYDPSFTEDDTMEGRVRLKNALLNAFVRGGTDGRFDADNLEQSYQIHLNVERVRVPETWFQPSMFGVDSAGVGELSGWLLNGFDDDVRARLMQVCNRNAQMNMADLTGYCSLRRMYKAAQSSTSDAQLPHAYASVPNTAQDPWTCRSFRATLGGVARNGGMGFIRGMQSSAYYSGRVRRAWQRVAQGALLGKCSSIDYMLWRSGDQCDVTLFDPAKPETSA